MTIDGQGVGSAEHNEVLNPSTGEVVGAAPIATQDDLDNAVLAAEEAFHGWKNRSSEERKSLCHGIGKILEDHAEELAHLLTLEQGKPLNGVGSRFEIGGAQAWAHYTADLELPVKVLQDNNEGKVELYRKPLGVVGSITPWNWPVMIAIWHIIPALRAGNTVVSKPSPYTPLSTLRMVELMNEVLPKGVVNCISGGDEIGAAMSGHDGIRKIVFTGSCGAGRQVMKNAANSMKRLTLELGGNDAGIVLPDVDPARIAEGLFWGAFINSGQTCAALKRLYVHDEVYDQVCDALVAFTQNIPMGDGLNENSLLGPIQNRPQFDKVSRLVGEAKSSGGRVLLGGDLSADNGLFFPPTIIADLDNGDSLVDEEQFGPVLPIVRYSDVDDVIARANDNPNGLGGSVWSRNLGHAKEVAMQLDCGSVWINKHGAIQPNAPFGGVKSSGIGVEFGEEGLHENTDIQVIYS